MTKWKVTSIIIISLLLGFLWVETINNFKDSSGLSKKNDELMATIDKIKKENEKIERDIEFYEIPDNLEKKLREELNYKNPGEKIIIVVPSE